MGCAIQSNIEIAKRNGWTREQFETFMDGAITCAYHWGIHKFDGTFIPFETKKGEYKNEEGHS